MLKAHETTREEYNTTPGGGPTTTTTPHALSRDPAWLAACEKRGHNPFEWQNYRLPVPGWDSCSKLIEDREAEQAVIRSEYDVALAYLIAVVKFAPDQVRQALGVCGCECCDA